MPSKLIALGGSMVPNFVPIAFGRIVKNVFTKLIHPANSNNATKINAILTSYKNLTDPTTIVLVGAFWRNACYIVKAWAAS